MTEIEAKTAKRPQSRGRLWLPFLLPLVVTVAAVVIWPPFGRTLTIGVRSITEPYLKRFFPNALPDSPRLESRELNFAEKARSMEWRIQEFGVDPLKLERWCEEWNCTPLDKMHLLGALLRRLPESLKASPEERIKLNQSIFALVDWGKQAQPQNAYFPLAEAIAHTFSNQDEMAFRSLQETARLPSMDLAMRELNASEVELWKQGPVQKRILASLPRKWSLDLDTPLNFLSRGLAVKARGELQKYNFEKALEYTFIHLGVAHKLAESGWTPRDLATVRAIVNRALRPFWTDKTVEPDAAQLDAHFVAFLEDQGDHTRVQSTRTMLEFINSRKQTLLSNLPQSRMSQSLSLWNASSIIGSLVAQSVSLLIVFTTVWFFVRGSPSETPVFRPRYLLASLAFGVAPILWSILGWPMGGNYMLGGLLLGWSLWIFMLLMLGFQFQSGNLLKSLQGAALTVITATLGVAGIAAWVFDFRQETLTRLLGKF
jgi:hypothetical protein